MQALKALVIGLGILILVAAGVIAVTIYKRATHGFVAAAPTAADGSAGRNFGTKEIAIPNGAHVEDVLAARDRLFVRLRLADGTTHLLVLDPDSGEPLGELDFVPAASP